MYNFQKLKSIFLGLIFLVVTVNFICLNEQEACSLVFETLTSFFARRPLAKLLVIGIASAPHHFQRRQAARATWMSLLNDEAVDVKFIVGRELCDVPPDDRVTPWDCVGWDLNEKVDYAAPQVTFKESEASKEQINSFTFLVKRSINLVKLGVASCALSDAKTRLILLNSLTNDKILSASFLKGTGDVHWKSVNLSLEEGFEGELVLKRDASVERDCSYDFNAEGVVHLFETSDDHGFYRRTTGGAESVPFGFTYIIDDPGKLKDFARNRTERLREWTMSSEILKTELSSEAASYDDLLFVDVVDVYSHLRDKIGLFFKWVTKVDSYEFILKADDDVFLDVTRIVAQLEASRAERVSHWWWSCFKVNSTPRTAGKWRDKISKESVYPEFPCGAGYVLSNDLIDELSELPGSHLGEDVALGFWARSRQLTTPRRPICYWSCGRRCDIINHPRCNLVELDSDEFIYKTWEMYKDCGNFICDCL